MAVFNENSGLFYGNNTPGISHSLHTCTSATSCPTDTSQGSCARVIPTQDLGWARLDATHPFPSFPPALAGRSRADQPCTHSRTLLCSQQGKPTAWSFSPCRHPQKSDARPSRHKILLLPAPPLIPMETSPQNSCSVGPGRCWHFPALELNTVPVTHTIWELGIGPHFVH